MRGLQTAAAALVFGVAAVLLGIGACKGVTPLGNAQLALALFANPAAVQLGGTSAISLTAFDVSGQPAPDGTQVTLAVNDGSIDPATVTTARGFASATYRAPAQRSSSDPVTIRATSGAAKEATLVIAVGGTVGTLTLTASPQQLPKGGGASTLTATARDAAGGILAGAPITFSTDKGTLQSGGRPLLTGSDGIAQDILTTTLDAKVTARSAAASVDVLIDVAGIGATKLTLTADPAGFSAGGGTATIRARAEDASGLPVIGLPVVFTTTGGSIAPQSPVATDSTGTATATLTTSVSATVTATAAGGLTGSVAIRVGNPTPASISILLSALPGSITKPIAAPTPAPACAGLGTVYDVALTATVSASGAPVPDTVVTFFADKPAARARVRGQFCGAQSVKTDVDGKATVWYGFTQAELDFCQTIAVPCQGSNCVGGYPCPTVMPTPTPGSQPNDCCCGILFTAQNGSAVKTLTYRVLAERDVSTACPSAPMLPKMCACVL